MANCEALAYDDFGSGVPIIFIHGLTFSRRTWAPVLLLLADRFRCVAVDLPGHGESAGLPDSLEEALRRVTALVADLGIERERPVVVGHSLGGLMATNFAAHAPVRGVVNIDQPLETRPFLALLQQVAPALRGQNFATAFEPIRQSIGVELLPEPLRAATLATQSVRQDVVLAYWAEPLRRSPEDLQAEIDAAVSRIDVPYLAVFGHRLADDERTALRTRLPRLELEEWPDRGHMVHLMDPDRFANRIAAFVSSCNGT